MMIRVIVLVLSFLSIQAFAVTSRDIEGFDNLSAEQKGQIISMVGRMNTEKGALSTLDPDKVQESVTKWSEIGTGIGKLAVSAAKELGVAASEFIQTPVGKVVLAAGLWVAFGDDAMELISRAIRLFVGFVVIGIMVYAYRRRFVLEKVETTVSGKTWYGRTLYDKKVVYRDDPYGNGESMFFFLIVFIANICMMVF